MAISVRGGGDTSKMYKKNGVGTGNTQLENLAVSGTTTVKAPVNDTDAVNKKYVDDLTENMVIGTGEEEIEEAQFVSSVNSKTGDVVLKTSDLENDSGYITAVEVPSGLPTVTTADSGKILQVSTDGVWAAAADNKFVVTLGLDPNAPRSTAMYRYIADKTYTEIIEAIDAEKEVVLYLADQKTYLPCLGGENEMVYFGGVAPNLLGPLMNMTSYGGGDLIISCNSNNEWMQEQAALLAASEECFSDNGGSIMCAVNYDGNLLMIPQVGCDIPCISYVVNFTDGDDDSIVSDKTADNIYVRYEANKEIIGKYNGYTLTCNTATKIFNSSAKVYKYYITFSGQIGEDILVIDFNSILAADTTGDKIIYTKNLPEPAEKKNGAAYIWDAAENSWESQILRFKALDDGDGNVTITCEFSRYDL